MKKPPKSRSKQIQNPLSRFMFWLAMAVLAFVGITTLTGQDWLLSKYIILIMFFCALTFTIWTIGEFRRGSVSLVSSIGQKITYKRSKEPVWFFLLGVVYLAFGIFFTFYLGYGLLFG